MTVNTRGVGEEVIVHFHHRNNGSAVDQLPHNCIVAVRNVEVVRANAFVNRVGTHGIATLASGRA